MDVLDACYELLVHAHGRFLVQSLVADDVVEKLAVLAKLHDQKQFTLGLDDLVELDYVRVAHFLKNLNLTRYTLNVFLVLDSALLEDLDGDLLVGQRMRRQLDFSKGTLTERLAHGIVTKASTLWMCIIGGLQVRVAPFGGVAVWLFFVRLGSVGARRCRRLLAIKFLCSHIKLSISSCFLYIFLAVCGKLTLYNLNLL